MHFPVFLDLRGKSCLVIGNGNIGKRKAAALREAGARVKIMGPGRKFALNKHFLVVVATSDRAFNQKIARACFRRNQLVNVVDDPELCNFIYPSRFKKGPLQVAVSTGGASPVLARHIRRTIEKGWGKSWGSFLLFLQNRRKQVLKKVRDSEKRRKIFMKAASKKIITLVSQGKLQKAKREFLRSQS